MAFNNITQRTKLPFEPTLIATMGGTGGVGASTVAWSVAKELLRREKSVLLIDFDLYAPTHRLRLGKPPKRPIEPVSFDPGDDSWTEAIEQGRHNEPDILTMATVRVEPLLKPAFRASMLIAQFRASNYDTILIDLPSHPAPLYTSIFSLVDIPLAITTTEPASLVGATHLFRSAIVYGILHHRDASQWERALVEMAESLPWDVDRSTLEHMMRGRNLPLELYEETIQHFRCALIFNKVRDRAEADLAAATTLTWGMLFGNRPANFGAITHDEQRWFYARNSEHLDYELGEDREGTVRSITANILSANRRHTHDSGFMAHEAEGLHLLGIDQNTPAAHARKQYRLLWEGLRRSSALTEFIIDEHLREDILGRLERANQQVIRQLPTDADSETASQSDNTSNIPRPRPAKKLEEARKEAGMSRRELSLRTRVGLRYVEAICEYRMSEFPREVYLRGYLVELARAVGLDQEQFVSDYMDAVHQQRQQNRMT